MCAMEGVVTAVMRSAVMLMILPAVIGSNAGAASEILAQQRYGTFRSFNMTWAEFKVGFGDVEGNYWIGNDRLHELTTTGHYTIRFELQSYTNHNWYIAEYSTFTVGDEASSYVVTVGGYSGNARDSMSYHNGMKFTAEDRDNDASLERNCAAETYGGGGFWYNYCCDACIHWSTPTWSDLPPGIYLIASRMTLIELNACESSPCINGGSCVNGGTVFSCNCSPYFTGTICESGIPADCGNILHNANNATLPSGWSIGCYMGVGDELYWNTPCSGLLQGLSYYGSSEQLMAAGGNYGCWMSRDASSPDVYNACFDNYGHDVKLSDCSSCTFMAVCVKFP